MEFKDIAKKIILLYARYVVKEGYEFDNYNDYRVVFYWIISSILDIPYIVDMLLCSKYNNLRIGFRKELKKSGLLRKIRYKGSKEVLFNVIKVMFDLFYKEIKLQI